MHKSSPQYFDGFKFVRISDLPYDQSEQLASWIPQEELIKLDVDGLKIIDCVDYKDYNYWFDNYLEPSYNIAI
ncbi:MAG: hypothetical protein RIC80_09505 [Cyclobacteriaceae bacterium]